MTQASKKLSSEIPNHEPTLHDVMDILRTISTWMSGTDSQFSHLNRGLEQVKAKLDDVQDDITSALAALDTESIKLLDHEQRIRRLEKSEA